MGTSAIILSTRVTITNADQAAGTVLAVGAGVAKSNVTISTYQGNSYAAHIELTASAAKAGSIEMETTDDFVMVSTVSADTYKITAALIEDIEEIGDEERCTWLPIRHVFRALSGK